MSVAVSAIVITKNEEQRIAACLASLDFADEIIVVDSGSTDHTREICEQNSRVVFYELPWEGFGIQKNRALERASGEWVFSLDADETVPPELAAEIRLVVSGSPHDGYLVRRKNFYRGQWIRHCGWWPDEILRLFRRERGRFNDRLVHESVEVQGSIGRLRHPIEHYSFGSVSDFISKADSYSTLGARLMSDRGRRVSAAGACLHAVATFFKVFFLKGGVLDGRAGLLIAVSNATGVFYRYMKCLELQCEAHEQ